MKQTIILLLSMVLHGTLFAQAPLPSAAEVEAFYNSKTLIVLEGGMYSPYNIYIKEEVEDNWKITPFEIISEKEFDEKKTDSRYSFLIITQTHFERDKEGVNYNFLNLLLGSDVESITEMPEFGSIPLSYSGVEDENYSYKLGVMINFLQNRVRDLKENPNISSMKNLKYYNKNTSQIKTNALLFLETDLVPDVQEESKIFKYYPYIINIVTNEELEKAIDEDKNEFFLHCVRPEASQNQGWSFKMIFGIQDGKMYYYGIHTITEKKPGGFLVTDFKRIAR